MSERYLPALRQIHGIAAAAIRPDEPPPPAPPPPQGQGPPHDSIIVRPPGTPSVLSRPVVVDLPMTAWLQRNTIYIEWPALLLGWSTFKRPDIGPHDYFGNSCLIYRTMGDLWVLDVTEWMRRGREDRGTSYEYDRKWRHGEPDLSYPIALFVAGLCRYSADRLEYRHRTEVKWFSWPDLKPYVWGG